MSNFNNEVRTNDNSTTLHYKPAATQKDTSTGILKSQVGGALSYQMGMPEQGLSETVGMTLSEALKMEKLGRNRGYTPSSEDSLGFSAVSSTGNQLTHASEIKADSILRIGGVEASADSLLKAGVISMDSNGNYITPNSQQQSEKKVNR